MRAAAPVQGTRIFGIRVGLDPKILVGGLIALAALMFWFNSRGDDEQHTTTSVPKAPVGIMPQAPANTRTGRLGAQRRSSVQKNAGELRIRPVDPSRGDVDPTLRLSLLERLRSLKPALSSRNLFEGTAAALPPVPKAAPMIPKPLPVISAAVPSASMTIPALSIPLKYYGFVKPASNSEGNRGFFLNGENILVATEGDVLEGRYLIVALTPNHARVEDMQMKQGQDVPVTPEFLSP
jgi:hypothetical protein